ncbi:MAG TPA: heavy metal-binding domain-containing protein [Thermoanaerobaculia bacterium]|nr:heavy metal-binding domain-containing protein [Thermoanaerobaculia bacterium]
MSSERFWISTGDIREPYETMNIVSASIRVFLEPDFSTVTKTAVDDLARAALALGANGVIWIRFVPVDFDMGFGVYATGTAVRVKPQTFESDGT